MAYSHEIDGQIYIGKHDPHEDTPHLSEDKIIPFISNKIPGVQEAAFAIGSLTQPDLGNDNDLLPFYQREIPPSRVTAGKAEVITLPPLKRNHKDDGFIGRTPDEEAEADRTLTKVLRPYEEAPADKPSVESPSRLQRLRQPLGDLYSAIFRNDRGFSRNSSSAAD